MPPLRMLNREGIARFREYLALIREGAAYEGSPALLFVEQYSQPVPVAVQIEPRTFRNRLELAQYLTEALRPLGRIDAGDQGLWSWLALYYFDQLAPADRHGRRRPREDYHFIPERTGWALHRHLVSAPWAIYRMHGDTSRVLLYGKPHEHGRFMFEIGHRPDLITNRGVVAAIDRLYWDEKTGRPRRGASNSPNPGSLRRFITVIDQIELNYDLYDMTADAITSLLPREFDRESG